MAPPKNHAVGDILIGVKFIFYQVFSGVHVKFNFYQVFSGVHIKFKFYQVFSEDEFLQMSETIIQTI